MSNKTNLDISNGAIKRLAHTGGVKRLSNSVYKDAKYVLQSKLECLVNQSMIYTRIRDRLVINEKDVSEALEDYMCGLSKRYDHPNPSTCKTGNRGWNKPPKKNKSKPGVSTLRKIRMYQKQFSCFHISKALIHRLSKESLEHKQFIFSKRALELIQYSIEAYMIELFDNSNLIALHSGRQTITSEDIQFATKICNRV